MPALKQNEKLETSSKKVTKNTLAESSEILSFNMFASLLTEENTEGDDCNESLDNAKTNFGQREKKKKSKRLKHENSQKKNKLPAMDIETSNSNFDSKGSTETFRCHICNRSQSTLKKMNEKSNKLEAEKKIGLPNLDMLLYCIAFIENKYKMRNYSSKSDEEKKSCETKIIR